jgi:D-alanyl-D-alanine carboxypeptidase
MGKWNELFFPLQYGYGLMLRMLSCWITLFGDTPELIGPSGGSGSFAYCAPNRDIFLFGSINPIRPVA